MCKEASAERRALEWEVRQLEKCGGAVLRGGGCNCAKV